MPVPEGRHWRPSFFNVRPTIADRSMSNISRWRMLAALVALLSILAWAYWPGLSGPFLFDDFGNLNVLGAYGAIRDWPTLLYYVTSGNADPTGRPVALLSFLLDAHEWPASPWSFKRTNLALHLLNAALLALTISRLQVGLLRKEPELRVASWAPLLAAALWASHPFFVSTTLYVVQREAMLPMTFVLLAILAWCRVQHQFQSGRVFSGWAWTVIGVGGTTLLAGFSKANGFLAPLLTGVAYFCCLRPTNLDDASRKHLDRAAVVCLALPTLLLFGWMTRFAWSLWDLPSVPGRGWSLAERLLSEPRALWTYLGRLAVPRFGGGGVFVDSFVVSRGWLQPVTTLPATLALVATSVFAVAGRRRFPIASFAWLFFLAGHVLEGTVVPLELYFEHRNYLPASMLAWPLAHALLRPGRYRRYRLSSAWLLLGAMLWLTHQRSIVWGDPQLLTALSASHEPRSARAQVDAAQQQFNGGDIQGGLTRIQTALDDHPDSVDVAISAIGMECASTGSLSPSTFARAKHALQAAETWNYGLYDWLRAGARDSTIRNCSGFGHIGLLELVTSAERNAQSINPLRKRDLWNVRGNILLSQSRPSEALAWFDAAVLIMPDPNYALSQAAQLGDAGAPELGIRHLDRYVSRERHERPPPSYGMKGVHEWALRRYDYYGREIAQLRRRLAADAHASSANSRQH